MGFPYYVAQNAAGFIQGDSSSSSGTLLFQWPYGDDIAGAQQIQAGYNYIQARNAGTCGCQ